MGGVNHQLTNAHTTLSASQSMTFSLGGVTPGASVAMPNMPLSRSQQVGTRFVSVGLVNCTKKPLISNAFTGLMFELSDVIMCMICITILSELLLKFLMFCFCFRA